MRNHRNRPRVARNATETNELLAIRRASSAPAARRRRWWEPSFGSLPGRSDPTRTSELGSAAAGLVFDSFSVRCRAAGFRPRLLLLRAGVAVSGFDGEAGDGLGVNCGSAGAGADGSGETGGTGGAGAVDASGWGGVGATGDVPGAASGAIMGALGAGSGCGCAPALDTVDESNTRPKQPSATPTCRCTAAPSDPVPSVLLNGALGPKRLTVLELSQRNVDLWMSDVNGPNVHHASLPPIRHRRRTIVKLRLRGAERLPLPSKATKLALKLPGPRRLLAILPRYLRPLWPDTPACRNWPTTR
jgi:hypothetical protein